MKYYLKFRLTKLTLFGLAYTVILIAHVIRDSRDKFYLIALAIYSLVWIYIISIYSRQFVLGITRKPLLEFNEQYIDDNVTKMRYYWNDIKKVEAQDNVLAIYFYEPEKYMSQVKTVWKRWMIVNRKKQYLKINIDFLDTKDLTKNLNNYSIASMETGNL